MKNLWITYHMRRKNEIAETGIVLPMQEHIADDILLHQGDSRYVKQGSFSITPVKLIVDNLAELQGYSGAAFCMAEEENHD